MFISEISTDGVKFRQLYVEGRLRNYANLNNALNGSRQILKNPKKHCVCVRILDKDTNKIVAYVRKTETGYDVNMIEGWDTEDIKKESILEDTKTVRNEISAEDKVNTTFNSLKKPISDLNNKFSSTFNHPMNNPLPVKKQSVQNNVIKSNPVDKEKISINDLIVNKITDRKNAKEIDAENKNDIVKSRVDELQKAHDAWKEKKESGEPIKIGDSINNISDTHAIKKVNAVYSELMVKMVSEAIHKSDMEKLFRLEFLLSKSGYSWYPKNGSVEIDTTENVVNMLKENPELLENRR